MTTFDDSSRRKPGPKQQEKVVAPVNISKL
jgi:hypothetical protein